MPSAELITIDCHYVEPLVAAAYFLHDGNEGIFVENNTSKALPYLLNGWQKSGIPREKVRYLIVTHIHLDHAAATGHLAREFPDAQIVAHPRAVRHLVDPSRLIQSSREVYGDSYDKLYGEILPVPQDRITSPEDEGTLTWSGGELRFLHTRGHANHHFVIHDQKSGIVFTGDSFGIAYPKLQTGNHPFLFPTTSPTDFDLEAARATVDRIRDCGAKKAALTHFDIWNDLDEGARQMHAGLDMIADFYDKIATVDPAQRLDFVRGKLHTWMMGECERRNIPIDDQGKQLLSMDQELNAQGLVFAANRAERKAGNQR